MGEPNAAPGSSPEAQPSESAPRARGGVLAVRLLMLVLAAGAVVAAVAVTRQDGDGGEMTAAYACPMHPEVTASKPGTCPICGMALEAKAHGGAGAKGHMDMAAAGDLAAVENVRRHKIIDFVRLRSLLFDTRELRAPAWVEDDRTITAVFYKDQIAALAPDEPATFTLTSAPKVTFTVRRATDVVAPWDSSTALIRFRVDVRPGAGPSPAVELQSGQAGWLEAARRTREVLGVPASAVLQSPEGPYVLASTGGFNFEKRPIQIGETFLKQGFVVVLSGLERHDLVVARATFFMDADRRIGSSHAREAGSPTP